MKHIILIAAACLSAGAADAHAFLDEATPRVGSTVAAAPTEIRIVYTEAIEPTFSHIALFAADGQAVQLGTVTVDAGNAKQLIAPIGTTLKPGHYEVRWNVVSVDTHHTNGHYSFDYQP